MHDFRFFVYLLEAVAAVSGFYYYKKKPTDKAVGFFSFFLLFTFFVETIGWIPTIIYRWEGLHFLKDSFWYKNYWLFNPYLIVSFAVYINYFSKNIENEKVRKWIMKFLALFVVTCLLNFIVTDVFLKTISVLTYGLGSFFLIAVILYYYYEILLSSKILRIKKEISFFISFAALFYFITTTPIFIYFKYFTEKSPEFVMLSTWIIIVLNVFMYGSYTLAFLWLGKQKKIIE